jgi:hypothetical protein
MLLIFTLERQMINASIGTLTAGAVPKQASLFFRANQKVWTRALAVAI